MDDVETVLEDLRSNGWATTTGNPRELVGALSLHGYRAAQTQRGASRQLLRPYKAESAPVHTMSAKYGLGAQPLHTDGAHLRKAPDVIVLYGATPSSTPTLIWSGTSQSLTSWHPEFAQVGIFTVRNGRDSFLTTAAEGASIRFDPACMSPGDGSARKAAEYFGSLPATEHHWNQPDKLLLINNRLCLHARAAVAPGDEGRTLERLTFSWSRT